MNINKKKLPSVNIIIRTLNEEDWIRSCLTRLFQQDYLNFNVTIVDSGSVDATLDIVRQISKSINIIQIDNYIPGHAINLGVASRHSDYILIMSAHCLPVENDFISNYVSFLESNDNIAGCYGRQRPLPSTHADDARDLRLTFGRELRIQKRDIFFHNANSMIRYSVWERFPMSVEVKHMEDRVWASEVINANLHIAYLPDSAVYHEHGLHQHGRNKSFRASGVVSVLNDLEPNDRFEIETVHGRKMDVPIIIIANQIFDTEQKLYSEVVALLRSLPSDESIFVLSSVESLRRACGSKVTYISRDEASIASDTSVRDLMRLVLKYVESHTGSVKDALSFIDLSYKNLNIKLYEIAREKLFTDWFKAVLPAWRDHGNFWIKSQNKYRSVDVSYEEKSQKSTVYRSILGQGGCIRASEIRKSCANIQIDELICVDDIKVLERY